jgi:hypothetical protein
MLRHYWGFIPGDSALWPIASNNIKDARAYLATQCPNGRLPQGAWVKPAPRAAA